MKEIKVSIVVLAAGAVLAACSGPGYAPKQDQGLVAGAVAGGVLGSQIGRGKGSVVGTVLGAVVGAVLFTTMSNAAVLLSVDPFWEMVLEGLLIALVVYLDNLQKRRQYGA